MTPRIAETMKCPSCGAEVEPRGVNESLNIASCGKCEKVIDLAVPRTTRPAPAPAPAPGPAPAATAARPPSPQPRMSMPEAMQVVEDHGGIWVTWKRASTERVGQLLYTGLLGLGFVVFRMAVKGETLPSFEGVPWLWALILAPLAYGLGAYLLNNVYVHAGKSGLRLRAGPVPWTGGKAFAPGEVTQLFTEMRPEPDWQGVIKRSTFVVSAVVGPEGRRLELIKEIPTLDQALWLEQTIERALGIKQAHVGGEVDLDALTSR